jgi:anti-sigma B factor antagonist
MHRRPLLSRRLRALSPAALCVLTGELDLATAAETRRAGWAALKVAGPDLVIDVSGVTFLDGYGLEPLVELRDQVRARGGRLTLVGDSPPVRRLLDITGLGASFGCPPPGPRTAARWLQPLGRRPRSNRVQAMPPDGRTRT